MYYRDDSEAYNDKINTDDRDDHHNHHHEYDYDYDYDEYFKMMPYYNKQMPYFPTMYYPMMYFYPNMWNMQKRDEDDVEDLDRKNHDHDHDDDHDHGHEHGPDCHCKYCENHANNIPMANMPMNNMTLMKNQMNMSEDDDKDLKSLYPKIYVKLYPMVKHHCDMMESMHGKMYCPSKDEMDHICKEICDKYEEHHKDDDDDDDNHRNENDVTRRRNSIQDLIRILLITDLLGRRRYGEY